MQEGPATNLVFTKHSPRGASLPTIAKPACVASEPLPVGGCTASRKDTLPAGLSTDTPRASLPEVYPSPAALRWP